MSKNFMTYFENATINDILVGAIRFYLKKIGRHVCNFHGAPTKLNVKSYVRKYEINVHITYTKVREKNFDISLN